MMKTLLTALMLALASTASAVTAYRVGPSISTGTGRMTEGIAGTFYLAASSITASTPTVLLNGATGGLNFSSGTALYGFKAGTMTTGGLGVGTTSPAVIQEISGDTPHLRITATQGSHHSADVQFSSNTIPWWAVGMDIGQQNTNNFNIRSIQDSATRLTMKTTGEVGLGTGTPKVSLAIGGGANAIYLDANSVGAGKFIGANVYFDGSAWQTGSPTSSGTVIQVNGNEVLFRQFNAGAAAGSYTLSLSTNNFVGINFGSGGGVAQYPLDVGGSLRATGNVIGASSGTFNALFGDGSHLTGITGVGQVSSFTYVPNSNFTNTIFVGFATVTITADGINPVEVSWQGPYANAGNNVAANFQQDNAWYTGFSASVGFHGAASSPTTSHRFILNNPVPSAGVHKYVFMLRTDSGTATICVSGSVCQWGARVLH